MGKKIIRLTEGQLEDLILKSIIAAIEKRGKSPDFLSNVEPLKPLVNKELKPLSSSKSGMLNKDFYEKLLRALNAPITDENLKFMYAWRQSEGDGGKYNPFNTTLKKPGSTFFNYLNNKKSIGVQNYPNEEVGIKATVDTLNHQRYDCITDGLRQDIGASEIARSCSSALKTWGTGDLIGKVLAGYDRGASIKVKDLA